MFLPRWPLQCVLLAFCTTASGLEIRFGHGKQEVICSQGLSECTMKDEMPLAIPENNGVDVKNLTPKFQLCCKNKAPCTLCLVIDVEVFIHPRKDMEEVSQPGHDGEFNSEETRSSKASVTLCYKAAPTMPTCKRVKFTINHAGLAQHLAKVSFVIDKPGGISFGSQVFVYPLSNSSSTREVVTPSLNEVCSQNRQKYVEECYVPRLSSVINHDMNHVELQLAGRKGNILSVCIQNEQNGRCQMWSRTTVPLYSVTPCTCLQIWDRDDQTSRRSLSCPFTNTDFLLKNIWENVSVSVSPGQMNDNGKMLLWKLSSPCRLEGEVWPCQITSDLDMISCIEIEGFRQQLMNTTWKQNSKGHWEKTGVFEDIDLQLSPCVMVAVRGKGQQLGPFCFNNTSRWRWSLLVAAVMLLGTLTVLVFCLCHGFVKRWVWSWHHRGFVKIGRKGHVVLLSPPDVDNGVSESVCGLGSLLRSQGFTVSVDQWSRKEQCNLGPLPWLHSQLLEINSLGGRVVLVLTHKALQRTEEWAHQHKEVAKTEGMDKDLPQIWSPYSDVFTASLYLILVDKQLGRGGERFLLVIFDSHASQLPNSNRSLPGLFQELPLFQLPSQIQPLLSELTVGRKGRRSGGRTWTGACL